MSFERTARAASSRTVVTALGLLLVAMPAVAMSAVPASDRANRDALTIIAPSTMPAGAEWSIELVGVPTDEPAVVLLISSVGSTRVDVPADAGDRRRIVIPQSISSISGVVTVVADAAGLIASANIVVDPGPAVGPIASIVGARSIVADGSDLAMVVSIPNDAFGNPVASQTPFTFLRRQPAGMSSEIATETSHLLAWAELVSGTVAGRGDVWILSGERLSGPPARLEEVAGVPVTFGLRAALASQAALPADGRGLTAVHTDVLKDAFGNVQTDGTQVVFEWVSDSTASRATAETIAGVATIHIQAPARPDVLMIQARARGVSSTPMQLTFDSAVEKFEVRTSHDTRRTTVEVGPVASSQGSLVADGTDVLVRVLRAGRVNEYRGSIIDGVANIELPRSIEGSHLHVEVLGLVVNVPAR